MLRASPFIPQKANLPGHSWWGANRGLSLPGGRHAAGKGRGGYSFAFSALPGSLLLEPPPPYCCQVDKKVCVLTKVLGIWGSPPKVY